MQGKLAWTFAITTIALFMTALDNLVVVTALPQIQKDLGASFTQLEWVVNAYTLTFAVLLLTGAALGDRFGRKLLFVIGLSIFTVASVIAALSTGTEMLIVARAIQGLGAAIVTPLTLTILAEDTPPEKRGAILGAWGGIAGLAVAIGPIVGGALTTGIAWQWIFWLNVPIGLVTIPLAWIHLRETKGPADKLDIAGVLAAASACSASSWGVVRVEHARLGVARGARLHHRRHRDHGRVRLDRERSKAPMLPLRFFRSRAFSAANGASVAMYFGMFGSIFLLTQFLQTVQGYSPLGAGLRMLAWTG